jgi:transposase-like protein
MSDKPDCPICKRNIAVRSTYQTYSQGILMQAESLATGCAPMPDIQNYVCLDCQREFQQTIIRPRDRFGQPLPAPPK